MKPVTRKCFTYVELMTLEQRYRATFINSLSGFKSIVLIGTKNKNGQTNLAIFNSIVHLGANPPLIGFISRPDSVARHTLKNIQETSIYTINHINKKIYKNAHQTSARYPSNVSEFNAAKLKEEYLANFDAPFVAESHVKLGVRLKECIPIKINETILVVGQIEFVHFPLNCICSDGYIDLEKADSITGSGLDGYHTTRRLSRLAYAKPDRELKESDSNYFAE